MEKPMFRNYFYEDYWHTFIEHDLNEIIFRMLTLVFIVIFGILAGRIVGKKSIHTLTLPNILFVFIFISILTTLILAPQHLIMKLIMGVWLIFILHIIERLQMKYNKAERIILGLADLLFENGDIKELALYKNKMTVDQLEASLRLRGIPSLDVVKTASLESNGYLSVEIKPDYEPVKKIYFDMAMADLYKALNKGKYIKPVLPKINNAFDETKTHSEVKNNGDLE